MKMTNLFFCPKCRSQRVVAVFSIPLAKNFVQPNPPKDKGHFKIINYSEVRNKKIDSILNDIEI